MTKFSSYRTLDDAVVRRNNTNALVLEALLHGKLIEPLALLLGRKVQTKDIAAARREHTDRDVSLV